MLKFHYNSILDSCTAIQAILTSAEHRMRHIHGHLAPTNNQDNHNRRWITANEARTVILAPSLSRENIFDAIRRMRVYATEDRNLKIMYKVNGSPMGTILDRAGQLEVDINIEDPDETDRISKVELIVDGGVIAASKSFTSNKINWSFNLSTKYKYYYVRVTQEDKDIAVTAPVWVIEYIPVKKFTDIEGHWANAFITELAGKGFIEGYQDGSIRPGCSITRAEAVALIAKAAGLKPYDSPRLNFADEKNIPAWVKGYVQAAADKEIIGGYEDNTFRAQNALTREEMIVMIMKCFEYEELKTYELSYSDNGTISKWSRGYIAKANELGVAGGYSDNTFRPKNNITRAEAFTIAAKCLRKSIEMKSS